MVWAVVSACAEREQLISTNLVENTGLHPRRPVSPVNASNAVLYQSSKSLNPWASVVTSASGSTSSRLEDDDAAEVKNKPVS